MATRGRLEGRITVPTGGWDVSVNDSGGGGAATATLAAGEYFLSSAATSGSSLIDAFAAALNVAASTDTLTVTLSAGEAGTGKVTITSSGSTTLAWTDTDLRDLLGFDDDLAAGTTWTGESQARALWLPDCAYKAPNGGGWRGWPESDFMSNEHGSGLVAAFMGQSRYTLELTWGAVSRPLIWVAHETTVNASWEKFARDCILATTSPWGTPGGPVRFYPDAASSSAFGTYTVPGFREIRPQPLQDGWAKGPWTVELPRLLLHPSYAAYGA